MSPGRIHRMLKMKRKALQDNERVERGLEESSSAESSSDDVWHVFYALNKS